MSFFIVSLWVGLGGLVLMALPGVRRHGHAGHARATRGRSAPQRAALVHHAGHGLRQAKASPAGSAHGHAAPRVHQGGHASAADNLLHYLPEPRVVFTLIALFGAFGNLLEHVTRVAFPARLGGAVLSAIAVEWLIVGPIWRLALRFTGQPSSPLEELVMERVCAVTAFKNGKGIVQVVHDGRTLQLSAKLLAAERAERVEVGDQLTIEEVDAARERVVVSLR